LGKGRKKKGEKKKKPGEQASCWGQAPVRVARSSRGIEGKRLPEEEGKKGGEEKKKKKKKKKKRRLLSLNIV